MCYKCNVFRFRLPIITLAAVFLTISCSISSRSDGRAEAVSRAPLAISVAEAEPGDAELRLELPGEAYAGDLVFVHPDTSGLLTKVLVNPGDPVAYNQVVGWVDPSLPGMSYSESPVRSKGTGSVLVVHTGPGNRVSPQSVVMEVGNLRSLEVIAAVPERYRDYLHEGMVADLGSRSHPGDRFAARVNEIAPVVERTTRTTEVTLLPDVGHRILPGQSVDVSLVLDRHIGVLMVPDAAITERSSGYGVFAIRDGRAMWVPVETGYQAGGRVEIRGGLEPGESVAVAGIGDLADGSPVRIVE